MQSINNFPYFTDIENAFGQHRGKAYRASPKDWALMSSWKETVPLHIVLSTLSECFKSNPNIYSLSYCANEIEKRHAEWLKSQVGAGEVEKVYNCDLCFDTGEVSRKPVDAQFEWELEWKSCGCRK